MRNKPLVLASRQSPLALWQSHWVIEQLKALDSSLEVVILPIVSQGDQLQDRPLQSLGGKALFVKALEQALLDGRADMAVHSIKDMAAVMDDAFAMPAILPRADARDAWISDRYPSLADCPSGSVIGTSSLRRTCQIKHHYPALACRSIRGNVQTRLQKMTTEDYAGVVMAAAGLLRLDMSSTIRAYLSIDNFIPAIAQGAVGVECLSTRKDLIALLQALDCVPTRQCVMLERQFNARLGGDCFLPIAAHAQIMGDQIKMQAMVGDINGENLSVKEVVGIHAYLGLGQRMADDLLKQGAEMYLARARGSQ